MYWVALILNRAIQLYMIAIMIYALMSWFPGGYQSALGRFLARIVEPFQGLFNFATIGMLNFAPVVALIVLSLVQGGITYLARLLLGV